MSENNWLEAEVFDCSNCRNKLFKVGHSPLADEDIFYCNSCPKRVDVGFYDKKRTELAKQIEIGTKENWQKLIKIIESQLKPCDCGGNYQFKSLRRCCYCSEIIKEINFSFELYPSYFYCKEDKEPTEEETEKVGRFMAEFIRTKNIWK